MADGRIAANKKRQKITDEQILEGIEQGLTRQEIADIYGVHVENLARRMKRLGVHATYAPNHGGKHEKRYGECWHYIESQDKAFSALHSNFKYIETRKANGNSRIRMKCKSCGNVIERAESTIRIKNIRCEHCFDVEKNKKELNEKRVELMRFFIAYKELKTPKQCCICGEEFYSQYSGKKYCSDKCKNINKKKTNSSIRKRCRKYGVYYDPSVKSVDVFKRDHYICQICGIECITNDDKWGYVGPYSPSIDHIVPLAKGGTHTWGNTQCTHIICNSYKRDLLTV